MFGAGPVTVTTAHVAVSRAGAATVPGTTRAVTFGGEPGVVIGAGERVFSDPVDLALADQADLAVSLYFAGAKRTRHLAPGRAERRLPRRGRPRRRHRARTPSAASAPHATSSTAST